MTQSQPPRATESLSAEDEHPRGTLVILLVYLVAIVASWTYVYLLMWNRG